MGNQLSIPSAADGNAFTTASASNAPIKFSLPTEILFEVLAFVKFHEAPNIFLVNRYLLQICQVYFHSGTVGLNKKGNVRDLAMRLTEGSFTIFVKRNGMWQSVPVPELDPPKILNGFGNIIVRKCCRIQAMQFLNKFQSLLTRENNDILIVNDDTGNVRRSVVVDEKKFFLNWIGQKELFLILISHKSYDGVARCLANEPLIAQYNGNLCLTFNNERNLCGLEEDAKLIYGWISTAKTKQLGIRHYDAQKARELACQIVLLFEQAHLTKIEAEKMDLIIFLPKNTIVPMQMQKVYNGNGDQLATLRTFSVKYSDERIYTSAYVFYTKQMEYYYEKMKETLFSA